MEKSRSRVTEDGGGLDDENDLLVGPPEKQVVKLGFHIQRSHLERSDHSPNDKDLDIFSSNNNDSSPEILMNERQ